MTDAAVSSSNGGGVAGRTNYGEWEKKTTQLVRGLEEEEKTESARAAASLGLDGRHARSQAEADERGKAAEARRARKVLDGYRKRESRGVQVLAGLLGPVIGGEAEGGETDDVGGVRNVDGNDATAPPPKKKETVYVTRDLIDAGKRVLTVSDTTGPGHIVLTQDLTHLECAVPANASLKPKSYEGDAENDVVEDDSSGNGAETAATRKVHGLVRLNLSNLHGCTVVVHCKIITGTLEVTRCSDLTLRLEKEATCATVQVDLCRGVRIEFRDAPSGKNIPGRGGETALFWGDDANDRVFHAGVSGLAVALYRDGFVDLETGPLDYQKLGAKAVGNASSEEVQFVTSVVDGELVTERVVKAGTATSGTGGGGARAMTAREMEEVKRKRDQVKQAVEERLQGVVKVQTKDGEEIVPSQPEESQKVDDREDAGATLEGDDVVEEVYTSMSKSEIDTVVADCEAEKAKGNEAFKAGEYGQAVLHYSLALDRAAELPDAARTDDAQRKAGQEADSQLEQLFPRHVVLSNRSACFLKLGHHDKALADGTAAEALDPSYVKGVFRKGLALHAMGRYEEAVPVLAAAYKIEPKNKQIRQALQFAEMRLQQQMQKRMQG